MGKNSICALFISILVHGLVAAVLIAYLECTQRPDVLATLDLSSVELSFAEDERETRPAVSPPAPAGRDVPSPPREENPPEAKIEKPVHRELGEIRFPEPGEDTGLEAEGVLSKDNRTIEQPDNSPMAPRQARLDAPPRPKRSIRPDYPKGARQRGEQGEVVLEIRVNAEGTVDDVKVAVSSGFAELDESAVKAAKAARFSPARSGRESVASMARLKLRFKLK